MADINDKKPEEAPGKFPGPILQLDRFVISSGQIH